TPDESQRRRLATIAALTRIDSVEARKGVRKYMTDSYTAVRTLAIHSASLWRDADALPELISLLNCPAPHTRRAAAEAVGRIGDPKAVRALRKALRLEGNDRALDHSLTFALIEIGAPVETVDGLGSDLPRVRRAVWAALDGMPGGALPIKNLLAEL